MGVGFVKPLDLEMILINIFSGSTTIFLAISFVFIAMMAARWRMPNVALLVSFALFFFLIVGQLGDTALWVVGGLVFIMGIALVLVRFLNK